MSKKGEKPDSEKDEVGGESDGNLIEVSKTEEPPKATSAGGTWLPEASWATSWMNTAKEKTKSTFETIKKDINEFSDTLQNETHSLASAAAKKAQQIGQIIVPTPDEEPKTEASEASIDSSEKNETAKDPVEGNAKSECKSDASAVGGNFFGLNWVKQMANEVVETVHKFATEDTTKDEAENTEVLQFGGRKTLLNQCVLFQMQNDHNTFLQALQSDDEQKLYNEWLTDFKISEYNGEINLLLGQNPRLREIYAELVPDKVDNHTFWHRYFFKVHVKEAKKRLQQQQEELKINTDKNGKTLGDGPSPAPSNNGKDDWSMCSSGRTAEAEELEADAHRSADGREDAQTPRPPQIGQTAAADGDDVTDDWEECEAEMATKK